MVKNTTIKITFLFFLFLIPFDSLPFVNTGTENRPVFVFPLLLIFVLMLVSGKLYKGTIAFVYGLIALFFYDLLLKYFNGNIYEYQIMMKSVIIFFITLIMGCSIIGTNYQLSYSISKEEYIDLVSKTLLYLSFFLIPLSMVQILGRLGIFNGEIVSSVTSTFSYRTVADRVQFVSGEASQAFRYNVFFLIFFLFSSYARWIKLSFVVFFTLVTFISGSSYALLSIFILFLIYFIVFKLRELSLIFIIKLIFAVLSCSLLFSLVFLQFANEYTVAKLEILKSLLLSPSSLFDIIENSGDGSSFSRIVNPIIGVMVMIKTNLFGVGSNAYHTEYIEIVKDYFPFALSYQSVSEVYYGENYMTAKSMLSKLMAEFGMIGLFLCLSLIYRSYTNLRKYCIGETFDKILFSYLIFIILFAESYIYPLYYVIFCYFIIFVPKMRSNS